MDFSIVGVGLLLYLSCGQMREPDDKIKRYSLHTILFILSFIRETNRPKLNSYENRNASSKSCV